MDLLPIKQPAESRASRLTFQPSSRLPFPAHSYLGEFGRGTEHKLQVMEKVRRRILELQERQRPPLLSDFYCEQNL